MYRTSSEYKEKILEPTRKFESEIKIGNNTLTNEEVMSFNIEQSIQQDATFGIGNTISTAFNLVFFHNDIIKIDDTDIITAKLGLILNNEIEYIPMGIYNIDNIETNDTTTTVLAYDNMIKFDVSYIENNEKPTLYTVINRLIELTGVKFAGNLNDYSDYELTVLDNYTCREILGFIAGILGANATIDRNGDFNFVVISNDPIYGKNELCTVLTKDGYILQDKNGLQLKINSQTGYITADNYFDYTKKNKNYKVSRITNSTDLEELSIGTNENMELSMSNPYITENTLKVVNNNLNGLEFLPYSVTWQGDISLDIGDLVTVTDKKGSIKAHPILTQSISYNGALSCILGAQGETTTANTYKSTSSEENEVERPNKKVVQIEKDAGEVYVVVYDEDNQSSVRLTESTLEAIANEIKLTANNITLEGMVTANENFKVLLDGSIEVNNGKFTGYIIGSDIYGGSLLIGDEANGTYFEVLECGEIQAGSIDQWGKQALLTFANGQLNLNCYDDANYREIMISMNGNGVEVGNCTYGQDYITPFEELFNIYGDLEVEGNITGNNIRQISDRFLKDNIKYVKDEVLNKNATINTEITLDDLYKFIKDDFTLATYNYKNDDKFKLGFIAQDVIYNKNESDNKIGQLIVNPNTKDDFLSYDIGNCMSVGLGALKKVIQKVENMEKRLETLNE